MFTPPPPEAKRPSGIRDRQSGIWLVFAVVAAVVVVIIAFSFDRSEPTPDAPPADAAAPDATLPVDPATDPSEGPVTTPDAAPTTTP